MGNTIKQRQANVELMRIFAMFLIVVWHIYGHYMEGCDTIHPLVQKAMGFITGFISFHVDLFILITGYFGIKNNKKAIVKNLLLCAFYLWVFNLISLLSEGTIYIEQVVFPISHSPWWFMTVYFLMVLVAPFVEKMFSTFCKKDWYAWIITVTIINVYFGHLHHVGSVYLMGFNLINMINVYSIGAFIRTQQKSRSDNKVVLPVIGGGGVKEFQLL